MPRIDFQKQAQEYYGEVPVIILGSGASAAFGMSGMSTLARHLVSQINVSSMSRAEQESWSKFSSLLESGIDLESALHEVHLTNNLVDEVVLNTWALINPEDLTVFEKSLKDRGYFPLGRLLKHTFHSAIKQIDIVTTNYDRLAEYACEQEGLHHYSGFSHGYLKTMVDGRYLQSDRRVNIWKVHGSLDWMKRPEGDVCALGQIATVPSHFIPQIVTPGNSKYLVTHRDPYRTVITQVDIAIMRANSYLCIGFGFNDDHIQEKLVEKCVRGDACLTVVTRELTEAAKKFIFESGVNQYLAIERGAEDGKSVVYSSLFSGPLELDANHWSLSGYLTLIL